MNLLINFLFFALSWSQTAAGGVSLPQGEGELWKGGKDPRSQTNTSIILQTPVSSPAFPCRAPGWPKVGEMGSSGWATCEQEPGLGELLAWLRVWISGTRGFQQLIGPQNGLVARTLKPIQSLGRGSAFSSLWAPPGAGTGI